MYSLPVTCVEGGGSLCASVNKMSNAWYFYLRVLFNASFAFKLLLLEFKVWSFICHDTTPHLNSVGEQAMHWPRERGRERKEKQIFIIQRRKYLFMLDALNLTPKIAIFQTRTEKSKLKSKYRWQYLTDYSINVETSKHKLFEFSWKLWIIITFV